MAASIRDWQPGDGVRCAHAGKAPAEIPCGPPIKTAVQDVSNRGQSHWKKVEPLCSHHAGLTPAPGKVMLESRKAAAERLIVAHWDEYRGYLMEAIAARLAEEAG